MLAGMQPDRFTPLKNGPLLATEIATALGVKLQRLEILLYALVRAGLLTVNGGRFGYTPEADAFLVAAARTTSAIVTNCIRIFGTISCRLPVRFALTHRLVNMTSLLCPMRSLELHSAKSS